MRFAKKNNYSKYKYVKYAQKRTLEHRAVKYVFKIVWEHGRESRECLEKELDSVLVSAECSRTPQQHIRTQPTSA